MVNLNRVDLPAQRQNPPSDSNSFEGRKSDSNSFESRKTMGVPKNLKKGGPQFPVYVSTENIGEDQKKKSLHVFRRPIYPPKSSEDQKKRKGLHVFRLPIYPPKSSEDQKRERSTRPQMSCFHCFADCRYISVGGGEGCDFSGPLWIRP